MLESTLAINITRLSLYTAAMSSEDMDLNQPKIYFLSSFIANYLASALSPSKSSQRFASDCIPQCLGKPTKYFALYSQRYPKNTWRISSDSHSESLKSVLSLCPFSKLIFAVWGIGGTKQRLPLLCFHLCARVSCRTFSRAGFYEGRCACSRPQAIALSILEADTL